MCKTLLFVLCVVVESRVVSSRPYSVPYRNPTDNEIRHDIPIRFSSNDHISDVDTAVETKIIDYLVEHNFLREQYRVWWNQLKNLGVLTPGQASQMMAVKRKERKALLEFQKNHGLPQTGVIDNGIREVVFGSVCGTADTNDSEEEKKR